MYKLIRRNVNNSESAFSGANLSWPFGSAVLINKPGLSLVRKARLAHRNTAFRSVSLCQRGQAARWHRVLGVSLWNVRGVSLHFRGDCTRAIFFPWCGRKTDKRTEQTFREERGTTQSCMVSCDACSPQGTQRHRGGPLGEAARPVTLVPSFLTAEILRVRQSAVCTSFSLNTELPSNRWVKRNSVINS